MSGLKTLSALLVSICLSGLANQVTADLVDFNLRSNGTAGAALDGTNGSFTQAGLTLSILTTSSLPGATGSVFNPNTSGGGVDTLGVSTANGDGGNQLDAEETMTLTLTFSGPATIDLTAIDFQGQTGDDISGDQIFVTIGGTTTPLFTGAADYNGTTDLWTPTTPFTLSSGDTIAFAADDAYRISNVIFDVAAIPEPSSIALLGLSSLALACRRRRKLS